MDIPNSPGTVAPARAYALDALRGLAILAMVLSGRLPFDHNALPSWMYQAQEPPPLFNWIGDLPGITWVDLVFPFFLFAMGAAFPLALTRRMIDNGQNPMIAYAGINSFVVPLLALTGVSGWLTQWATSPWRGFGKGACITLLVALTTSFLTRKKIFWRT
jgi:predicted acyltransferase